MPEQLKAGRMSFGQSLRESGTIGVSRIGKKRQNVSLEYWRSYRCRQPGIYAKRNPSP